MLIPGSARLKSGLLLPSTCIVIVSLLFPMCVSRFLPCCQSNKSGSFFFVCFACNFLPTSYFPQSLCHVFHILGMSMCYLLTLCMNANTSVYSNRESYPLIDPWLLTKNGSNVVQIRDFTVFSYIFM